jgi:hypothetical protein
MNMPEKKNASVETFPYRVSSDITAIANTVIPLLLAITIISFVLVAVREMGFTVGLLSAFPACVFFGGAALFLAKLSSVTIEGDQLVVRRFFKSRYIPIDAIVDVVEMRIRMSVIVSVVFSVGERTERCRFLASELMIANGTPHPDVTLLRARIEARRALAKV